MDVFFCLSPIAPRKKNFAQLTRLKLSSSNIVQKAIQFNDCEALDED